MYANGILPVFLAALFLFVMVNGFIDDNGSDITPRAEASGLLSAVVASATDSVTASQSVSANPISTESTVKTTSIGKSSASDQSTSSPSQQTTELTVHPTTSTQSSIASSDSTNQTPLPTVDSTSSISTGRTAEISSSDVKKSTSTAPTVLTSTYMTTITASDGSTTAVMIATTTTPTPSLSASSGSGTSSGMTKQTRNTIIGVVVGVGGAIALCFIGLVAWRIWGRNKLSEEHDELMDYGTYNNNINSQIEKTESPGPASAGVRSPFQSTLETYHSPTQVNTASNF